MSQIFQKFDPAWEAYKASMQGQAPVQTPEQKADQAKMDAFLQDIYDPSSPNYKHYVGSADQAFPEVQKWIQQSIDWEKQLAEGFTKKYGHSPILETTVTGPPSLSRPTNPGGPGDLSTRVAPPQEAPIAWNAGDVWDMNRAPQDVVDSMKKYAETHDEKYYQSQIPKPAGSGLVAPPLIPPNTDPRWQNPAWAQEQVRLHASPGMTGISESEWRQPYDPNNPLGNHPVYNPDGSVRGWEPINPNPKQAKFSDKNGIRTFYDDNGSVIGSGPIDDQGRLIVHENALTTARGTVAPPDIASGNPNAKLVGPGTGSTSPWYDASGVQHPGASTGTQTDWWNKTWNLKDIGTALPGDWMNSYNYWQGVDKKYWPTEWGGVFPGNTNLNGPAPTGVQNTVTTAPVSTAPVIPPSTINPSTTSAVTPPATSPLSTNLLVTQPGATAAQNTIASLQNLLGRAAVGGVGSFKMPDFFKQTQQKWGGFSPAAFSKR